MRAALLVVVMFLASHAEAAKKMDVANMLGGPQILSSETRMALANMIVLDKFQDPLCRKAYQERFRLDPAEEWFEERYTIGFVPGFLPMGSLVRGATYCKASEDNMVLSELWVALGDVEDTAEVIMHEFFHLLQCQYDPPLPEPDDKRHADAMEQMEAEAYAVTAICMGDSPAQAIKRYNFTPKGFEQWDGKTN